MNNKVFIILLCIILIFALVSCTDNAADTDTSYKEGSVSEIDTESKIINADTDDNAVSDDETTGIADTADPEAGNDTENNSETSEKVDKADTETTDQFIYTLGENELPIDFD